MKTKLFFLLFAIVASIGTMSAWDDYRCGENLTWSFDYVNGIITISGNGDMYDYYNDSGRFWNQGYYNINISDIKKIVIEEGVTSIGNFAFGWAQADCPVTEVVISNTVTRIGKYAFWCCSSLTSIIIPNSVTNIEQYAFNGCTNLTNIFVPCGKLEQFRQMVDYKATYEPLPYNMTGLSSNMERGRVAVTANVCEGSFVEALPERGYQFISWADGNTDNPRTIELVKDTTLEAIFDYLLTGKCGKDSALTWTLDTTSMTLSITGKGALSENYTYGKYIESLIIGNEVTIIGQEAFYSFERLKNITIGSNVKLLEYMAFRKCYAIETITCYSQRPPTVNDRALDGVDYSTIVYVPAEYLETYKMHDAWGVYDVRQMGESTTDETVSVTINYEDKDGAALSNEPFTFHFPEVPEVEGFTFLGWQPVAEIINGSITIQAMYKSNDTSYSPASLSVPGNPTQKLIREGNVYILRDNGTYTATGMKVE